MNSCWDLAFTDFPRLLPLPLTCRVVISQEAREHARPEHASKYAVS